MTEAQQNKFARGLWDAAGVTLARLTRPIDGRPPVATVQDLRAAQRILADAFLASVKGVVFALAVGADDFAGDPVVSGDVLAAADGSQWVVQRADIAGVQDEITLQTTRAVGDPLA